LTKGTQRPQSKNKKYGRKRKEYPLGDLSKSSNLLLFFSLQRVQKRQVGTIFHATELLSLPEDHQHANKSITLLGITQDIPKRLKRTPQNRSHITIK
jgi:hypothetical protein